VVILLAGAGVGGFLLLNKDDDKDKKDGGGKNIERLAEACPLLSPEEVGEKTGVTVTAKETARKKESNRIRLQCSYMTSDQRLFAGFIISIFNKGLCEPQACVDRVKRASDKPVEGIGDAAVFGIASNNRGQLFAVKSIGGRSIALDVVGPGPNIKAEDLAPYVEKVFKKLEEGDYKEGDEVKAPAAESEQPGA
jgi:hypothetical protein